MNVNAATSRVLLFCAVLLLVLASLAAGQEARDPNAGEYVLNAYRTAQPPALDGKDEDACWQGAEVAKDFVVFMKPEIPATPQTECRVAYDATNLYVFWKMYEPDVSKVPRILEETRDFINPADSGELMLDPGNTDKYYFQLISNASGHLFDASRRAGTRTGIWYDLAYDAYGFSPDWKVAIGSFEGGWTMEQQVPFGDLVGPGEMCTTPQPGEVWGLSFCRNSSTGERFTQWSPSFRPGFRDPPSFGHVFFRGFKSGERLPVITKAEPGELFYGPSGFSFTLEGVKAPIQATGMVSRDGVTKDLQPVTLEQDGTLTLAYHLLESGNSYLSFSLKAGEEIIYTGQAFAKLPRTEQILTEMDQQLEAGQKYLIQAGTPHRSFVLLRGRLQNFARKVQGAREAFARKEQLSVPEWRELVETIDARADEWKALEYDLHLAQLYPTKAPDTPLRYAVGIGTSYDKFYPDLCYRGSLTEPVSLHLAGNEYGSFQLVIVPFWTEVNNLTFTFSDLSGPGGTKVSADNYRWFRQEYVKLENRDPDDPAAPHALEPDPLLEGAPVSVKAGTLQPVWVDLYLPAGTPAGTYRGKVTVSDGQQSTERDIMVTAYGVDLPARCALQTDWWFGMGTWLREFYGRGGPAYTPEIFARQAAVLGRYRCGAFPADWTTIPQQVPIYREADGSFSFDWSTFDKYVEISKQQNTNLYSAALSCNGGWVNVVNSPGCTIIDRATGEKRQLKDYYQAEGNWRTNRDYYRNNPLYRDFLVKYVAHLKELGILEDCYWEIYDEANPRDPDVVAHSRFIHEVVPELKLMNYGMQPLGLKSEDSILDVVGGWAPGLHYFDSKPGLYESLLERKEKYGQFMGAYVCGEGVDGEGNYSPFRNFNRPLISVRMNGWAAWRWQLDEYLLFMLQSVPAENAKKPPEERWPNTMWSDGAWRCGGLIYPGPDYDVVPGMMLSNARDGLEDFDLMAILREEAKGLDKTRDAALLARVEKALDIHPEIYQDTLHWTKDPAVLEARRDQVAALILEVRKVTKG